MNIPSRSEIVTYCNTAKPNHDHLSKEVSLIESDDEFLAYEGGLRKWILNMCPKG